MSCIGTCLRQFIKPIQEPIRKYLIDHFLYIIQAGKHLKVMEQDAITLDGRKKTVEQHIKVDDSKMLEATPGIKLWLESVEELELRLAEVRKRYEQRNCMFLGRCSFNCFVNHSISREIVEELHRDVLKQIDIIDGLQGLYTMSALPEAEERLPPAPFTESSRGEIDLKLKEVVKFLRNDRDVLGIYGMGGVGKTTLLNEINNKLQQDPSFGFHRVIFLTVSKDCTKEKIQKLIIEELGLPKHGDHYSYIYGFLSKKSFLILLDDVWEPLDLRSIGIPIHFGVRDDRKQKLILTSRQEEVCINMGVEQCIKVSCLSKEAGRLLFRETIGGDAIIDKEIVDVVADECDGLPLAIIAMARALTRVDDVAVWQGVVNDLCLSKSDKLTGTANYPIPLLKVSFDRLDKQKQECLLHCALYPEDWRILKDDLIQLWMGHGLLGEDPFWEAYNKGCIIINSLKQACMLEQAEPLYWDLVGNHFKLHDIIRDMALWIARESKWVVLARQDPSDVSHDVKSWSEAHKLSAVYGYKLQVLPSKIPRNDNLVTLMMRANGVLRPSQLSILENFPSLRYLDLSFNNFGDEFPIEICSLVMLEYLNLTRTGIKSLPDGLVSLTKLRHLLLAGNNLTRLPNGLLSALESLVELDIQQHEGGCCSRDVLVKGHLDCLKSPLTALLINVDGPDCLEKLAQLTHIPIRSLCIESNFSGSLKLLSEGCLGKKHMHSILKKLLISKVDLKVLDIDDERQQLPRLESLVLRYMSHLTEILWNGVDPAHVFGRLREINLYSCRRLKHVSWTVHLPHLEVLTVQCCESMEHIVVGECKRPAGFQKLRFLGMFKLPQLTSFCDGELMFPCLEHLNWRNCTKLKKFPLPSLESCPNIKTIRVDSTELKPEDDALLPFIEKRIY